MTGIGSSGLTNPVADPDSMHAELQAFCRRKPQWFPFPDDSVIEFFRQMGVELNPGGQEATSA